MATKPATPPLSYIAGDDPESIAANERYQKAMQKLAETLESRRKPLFDPMFLALARGAGTPTKTGGWGESLGNIASELGKAQVEQQGVESELANLQMQMAGQQIEMQREKQRQREFAPLLTPVGGAPAPAGGLGAAPAGGLAQVTGGAPDTSSGPDRIGGLTRAQFLANASRIPGMTAAKAMAEWNKMAIDAVKVTEGGRTNLLTGEFEPVSSSEPTSFTIEGSVARDFGFNAEGRPTEVKVPKDVAIRANQALRAGKREDYMRILRPYVLGFDSATAEQTVGAGQTAQGQVADKRAGRIQTEQERQAREAEQEAAKAAAIERQKKLAEASAKKEADIKAFDQNARTIYGITGRVENYLNQSENYFGIFKRPNLMSAIGNFVSQGLQTPNGTINLPGLEGAVTAMMPGAKQADLDNVQKAAADLAQMELLYTRLYFQGQGAVTEGERRIVQRLSGNVSNSPEFLRARMALLKERSQFDMDIAKNWNAWEKKNPGKSFLQFERSEEYADLERNYEKRLGELEGRLPALPSSERPARTTPAGQNTGLDAARARARKALEQGKN